MSAFHRFIFSTFLILALCFFSVSSVFADTTYNYFQDSNYQCYATINQACSARLAFDSANYQKLSPPRSVSLTNCQVSSPQYSIRVTYSDPNYPQPFQSDSSALYIANTLSKTCPSGTILKVDGCNVTCVPDSCNALKDQEFSGASACGSFACNTGTLQNGSCDGKVVLSGASSTVTDTNKCIGTLVSNNLTKAYYKKEDNGKASGTAYCSATYKYTGASDASEPTPLDLAVLALYQAVPLPDNGICPPSKPLQTTINGIDACIDNQLPDDDNCPVDGEKQNSNGVCVGPDDPTYPKESDDPLKPKDDKACPSGQIRNNSGVCVPYADAGMCPAGQVRSNVGTCVNDPKSNSCPVGQVKNSITGACSNDPKGTGCADGSLPDKQGLCSNGKAACPAGQTRDSLGVCVGSNPDKPDGTGCKDGSTPNASGVCSDGSGACPVGQVRDNKGKCVLDTTQTPKSGTASSDCLVPPECAGDPLQCASLEQTWLSTCEQTKSLLNISDEDKTAIDASIAGSKSDAATAKAEVDAQASGFFSDFQSDAQVASTGQCMQDASFPVMGKSLNVPFSKACDFFRFLRILLLFSAYMISAQIIFRGAV